MGNLFSQRQKPTNQVIPPWKFQEDSAEVDQENPVVYSTSDLDKKAMKIITDDFDNHTDIFVINNLLMTVMFFENYEKDISKCKTETEKELNEKLLKEETKRCIKPDIILEKVSENVRFCTKHGPRKDKHRSLGSSRIYILNDNIEVLSENKENKTINQYSWIDKPNYQVRIKEVKERKGYGKLKLVDKFEASTNYKEVEETEPTSKITNSSHNSLISNTQKTEETYQYTTITNINTPKRIERKEESTRRTTLPETCFFQKKEARNLDDVDIDPDKDNTAMETHEIVKYIGSDAFMKHFESVIFPNFLGTTLGFEEQEIELATSFPGKIFVQGKTDENANCTQSFEVIPAVSIEWPKQASSFSKRKERITREDLHSGMRYSWPSVPMLTEIIELPCVVIPRGFLPKKGVNKESCLEWEIRFPRAERYLFCRMDYTQMRAYLFILALHKTYIEPLTKELGLLPEHIQHQMFWELENNYYNWPEHRLGKKILAIIENLKNRIADNCLPDYFIKQKNIFENTPSIYLIQAHKVFHEMLESPTMYFIGAIRNLKYVSDNFYAKFDTDALYALLTVKEQRKKSVANDKQGYKKKEKLSADQKRQIIEDARREKEYKERQENLKKKNERKESKDSIDLNWEFDSDFKENSIKKRELLVLFITNFIEIANKSFSISTVLQTKFYLKQAIFLTNLLRIYTTDEIVNEFEEKIKNLEETVKMAEIEEDRRHPPVPLRNSILVSENQQSRANSANLQRLNTNLNKTAAPVTAQKDSASPQPNPRIVSFQF